MSTEPDIVIRAAGLRRVFADFWGRPRVVAVDNLDLEVRRGEVFGLLGPNGAGKSTTVKLLLDLLRPTRGAIEILGRPPRDLRAKARTGYLPEETRLYPYLSGRETLTFFGKLFDLPKGTRQERVEHLLELVGLSGAGGRRVGEYSKGMQRRLGLAQALLNDPDLVVLDEPTSGLDPLGIREVKDLLRSLAERGKTVLLCSHLLPEVEDVCDRVQILYAGRTLAQGTLGELLAEPDSLRLTIPSLDGPALARVLAAVRQEVQDQQIEVDVPSRSLESFFLSTIEAARRDESSAPAPAVVEPGLEALVATPDESTEQPPEPADLTAAEETLNQQFGLAEEDTGDA